VRRAPGLTARFLSFNISPSELKDRSLARRILAILAETSFPPQRLEIEVTEAALVRDLAGAQKALGGLREAGARIALDDFGTGYSSLYHLSNFKLDKVKIDRRFIEDMASEPKAATLVSALLGLGRGLGLTVTAEGIDQPRQAAALRELGCQLGQGFLYGRAMSSSETLAFLQAHAATHSGAARRTA
jgi:EAL domain-containing protein (putative c-di-GMP-specific phosphodiesterase class I)